MNHGPWREIFYGEWSGYEVHLYENPDKYAAVLVFEKDQKTNQTKGVLILLNKIFVCEGDPSGLASSVGSFALVMEKFYPTFKAKYLILSSGPRYSKPDLITSTLDEAFEEVEKRSDDAMAKSKNFGLNMVELGRAPEEYAAQLFQEPTILPGLIFREMPEKITESKVIIGKRPDGTKAEESVRSFLSTVVTGSDAQRIDALQVITENAVLGGMTSIIFDDDDSFANMSVPNKKFAYADFPDLQPIGMPLKTLHPGETTIDLNYLNKDLFREVIRVEEKPGDYSGKESAEMLDNILNNERGKIRKLDDFEQLLLKTKEEEKMFHVYRAIRWVRLLSRVFPGYLDGRIKIDELVQPYMKTSGSISRIDLKGVPLHIKKAFIYSVMRSLFEEYASQKIVRSKVMGIIPYGEKYLPKNPKKKLDFAIVDILMRCAEVGIGFATSAEHEVDLLPEIVDRASMRITFIKDNEIALKERSGKPYRAAIRPRLSA